MKHPFFSIVIPTYNRASDLRFALFCILRQKFRDFEIVISDNCSTDNTQEIVSQFHDKRIRYSRTEKTVWNSFNIERGITLAKGKYIFLQSDDDFLLYESSLDVVRRELITHGCGFVRLNYLSMSLDRKNIFAYRVHKPYTRNTYLVKSLDNHSIVWFIRNSDPYFISGIIFRNDFPKTITVVDSDPAPWINILFYNTKKYGACFVSEHQMIGLWSRRKIDKNQPHHIFSLIHGKLRSEEYLNAVKSKLTREQYQTFLRNELYVLYVECFPMIKAKVGNSGLLQLSSRILYLAPEIKMKISFWILLIIALVVPETLWIIARALYLPFYARIAKSRDNTLIASKVKDLENEYAAFCSLGEDKGLRILGV